MDTGFVTAKKQTTTTTTRTSLTLAVILVSAQQSKLFVISRILADFFSSRNNLVNPNISRIFFQPSVFFHIADWGSSCELRFVCPSLSYEDDDVCVFAGVFL